MESNHEQPERESRSERPGLEHLDLMQNTFLLTEYYTKEEQAVESGHTYGDYKLILQLHLN